MLIPPHFSETDRGTLHDFIRSQGFGLLVSASEGEPCVTHLPFVLDDGVVPCGTLLGHIARANPQWHDLDGRQVLVVFAGPHAYISPSWYESDNVVPTWNYVAVHAYGTFRLADDPSAVESNLRAQVATYERAMLTPWTLDTHTAYFAGLLREIVGFRVEIARLEGQWKLSQNHPPERRERVARALTESGRPDAGEIARLIREKLRRPQ